MAVNPIKTPLTNMSFTPDVPSSALSATEYNAGYNVETDVRSIKSVLGDEYILSQIPGNIIFVTGGFLQTTNWYFLVATEQGQWYKIDDAGYSNITPQPDLGVVIATTTYGNITGNSSNSSSGTYGNVSYLSTTSTLGSGANFNVVITSGGNAYSTSSTLTVGNVGGNNWNIGDSITIAGNNLGGTHPANDLTFSIAGGLGNYGGSFTSNTSYLYLSGNTGLSSVGTYSNVSQSHTTGTGSGATFNIVVSQNNSLYSNGASVTSNTTFGNIAGTSSSTANGFYSNVAQLSTSGIGNGAVFNVQILTSNTNYASSAIITLVSGGVQYNNGDTVTLSGASLGGTNPANNLTFTLSGGITNYGGSFVANTTATSISGVSGPASIGTYNNVSQISTSGSGTGALIDFRISADNASYSSSLIYTIVTGGYGYNIGDTITFGGNNLGGSYPTNNLTFTISNVLSNYGGGISSSTSFGFVTGTSASNSNGNYKSVSPYKTTGSGTGAAFNITLTSNNASYTGNTTISVASGGNGYKVGDYLTIPGSSLGGVIGTNDLTFSLGNVVSSPSTTIVFNKPGIGYNVGDAITIAGNTIGGIYGTNDLAFIIGNTVGNLGGTITSSTTYTSVNGTTGATSSNYYSSVPQFSTSGSGIGAAFNIRVQKNNSSYANVAIVGVASGGNGYKIGDTITLSGANLGGTHPTNDLTFILGTAIGNYGGNFTGYNSSTVITASWNGEVVFLNDQINPPMFYDIKYQTLALYDNPLPSPDSGSTYIWNYDVTQATSGPQKGNVIPLYSSLAANFLRVYNSPNVGSLLVAGGLFGNIAANVTAFTPGTIQYLPTTIRWSQNFGLNSAPQTWAPTNTNIANELEINVRGPVIDGFTLNGNFYIFSYWDCVLMSPIAYTTTSAPVFGFTKVTDGRGVINENCWAVVDTIAYGVDARDIWSFNGSAFVPLGDQKVKNYFYSNLNLNYTNQIFMVNNSKKYQIEIYYPDLNSTGYCNQMLSYRYDIEAWNPPRQINNATMATESPVWTANVPNLASRGIVYSSANGNIALVQKDVGTSFLGNTISSLFQRNNISFGQPYSASVQVHRVLPEVYGQGNIDITVGGSDAVANPVVYKPTVSMPIVTNDPWVQIDQNEARVTTVQISANSTANTWQLSSLNWQITVVQDTR